MTRTTAAFAVRCSVPESVSRVIPRAEFPSRKTGASKWAARGSGIVPASGIPPRGGKFASGKRLQALQEAAGFADYDLRCICMRHTRCITGQLGALFRFYRDLNPVRVVAVARQARGRSCEAYMGRGCRKSPRRKPANVAGQKDGGLAVPMVTVVSTSKWCRYWTSYVCTMI